MSRKTFVAVAAPMALAVSSLSLTLGLALPQPAQADITIPGLSPEMPSLAPMLKKVMPAVVNISVTSKVEIQNPLMQDPFFRRFFDVPEPQEREAQATGSGTIVDAAKGYILTNNHVVEQADSIKVTLADDRTYDAKLVGTDAATDIAVLQIKATNLTALKIADSDALQVGDFVVAIGSPFGLRQTVTLGIVSALGRHTGIIGVKGYEDFIQTDASINPGNSGGALVNLKGELVGVPSNILSQSGGNIGIGFAIPANLAKFVMAQLIAHGEVQRGRIGVSGQNLTPELAKAFGLDAARGALVTQVLPGSPAEKAGLKSEDIIIAANGRDVRSFDDLRNIVGLMRVGDKVDLTVLRDGKTRHVTVEVGKGGDEVASGESLHPALAGATFGPVDELANAPAGVTGVVVQEIAPGSPASRLLRVGDVITDVNRKPVKSMDDFAAAASAKSGTLLLKIRRGAAVLFLTIQ